MILPENKPKSLELHSLFAGLISKYEMSFAVVDLNSPKAELSGYNLDRFIYPASMYKVFIGAEVLRRIELGDFSLDQKIIVKSPNDVDRDARIFPGDTRKLLNAGDEVTTDYLLDLMLTRSDNTASNCLIDLVGRKSITENIIYKNGWHGSDVTRKFLDRIKEDKPYQFSTTTMSCARHFAEFFYLVEKGQLVSPFVSEKLKNYMLGWNRNGRKGTYLSTYRACYRKGGWLETNLWKYKIKSAIASLVQKKWSVIQWSNDGAVITGNKSHYVLIVMSVNKTIFPWSKFPIEKIAKGIFGFME